MPERTAEQKIQGMKRRCEKTVSQRHSIFCTGSKATNIRKKGIHPLTPILKLFFVQAADFARCLLLWYLYRLCPIETRNISSLTVLIPLRTIRLYQRSFFMIPKVPSAWIDLFILRSEPWILSRFSITSSCMDVSSLLIRTVRFMPPRLHCAA